jgi:hypothetical protein
MPCSSAIGLRDLDRHVLHHPIEHGGLSAEVLGHRQCHGALGGRGDEQRASDAEALDLAAQLAAAAGAEHHPDRQAFLDEARYEEPPQRRASRLSA